MSICPYCDAKINALTIRTHDGYSLDGGWKCITLDCPKCHKVLSAQIDPVAIQGKILEAIKQR